jgi:hypothetical protein
VNNSLISSEICAANWLMNHRVTIKKESPYDKKWINFKISAICQSFLERNEKAIFYIFSEKIRFVYRESPV